MPDTATPQVSGQPPATPPTDSAPKNGADIKAEATASTEPKLLAGKFKTAEDLEKSYKELESKLGQRTVTSDASLEEFLGKAGLKPEDLGKAYKETGKLSDDHYKKLAELGVPKAVADKFIASEAAIAQAHAREIEAVRNDVAKMVGGPDQLNNLLSSAKQFLAPEEIDAVNARLANPVTVRQEVAALQARYQTHIGAGRSAPIVNAGTPTINPLAASSLKEFNQLAAQARAGNAEARRRMLATPDELIAQWSIQ